MVNKRSRKQNLHGSGGSLPDASGSGVSPSSLVSWRWSFFLTFTVGDWLKGYLELVHGAGFPRTVGQGLASHHVHAGRLISLVVDGIIAGVGGIANLPAEYFYPVSGAGVSGGQRIYGQSGLCHGRHHGKTGVFPASAFIPMILGFGCSCSGTDGFQSAGKSSKDRYRVMLVTPFMSC